ncbi:response regulator transcription factor [Nordella sp. HKS 07]|uniref:response regulator transcription factor n=1 Tax=Nordella sp. HKS 07 TaxID=2712222 RepID=UPI001FEE29DA|nr:response regulator transcription factor [Nordella sp. HKS 07]
MESIANSTLKANIPSGTITLNETQGGAEPSVAINSNIIVIEKRELLRDCLTRCLVSALGPSVVSFPSAKRWTEVMGDAPGGVVVLSIGGKSRDPDSIERELAILRRFANHLPIIVLADAEEPSQIVDALQRGVRGYIPTSVSLAIAIEALRLVRAGGTYAPAGSLIGDKTRRMGLNRSGDKLFTDRQADVLEALRKGKANKTIAYELNLHESTVKIHVRNIMKKLRAKNRTEVAYIAHEIQESEEA